MGPRNPLALLDWVDDVSPSVASPSTLGFGMHASSAPIQLNPNAPQRLPVPGPPPLANEDDLKARADRMTAESLLKSKALESGENATKAMEILVDVPENKRGKVIDDLDDKAFENLLDRVPHDQRERFAKLVNGSKNPARKLRLWAESHKSRARNDLRRFKGDVGPDSSINEQHIEELTREPGTPEPEYDASDNDERTDQQEANLGRHTRRTTSVVGTHGEIDDETERLLEKAKTGALTLADVDAVRERKDLEYEIERDNNLQLTSENVLRPESKERVEWSVAELQQVRTTLARLPDEHVRGAGSFDELERKLSRNIYTDGTGGAHQGRTIDIRDWASTSGKGFSHGGNAREIVSDDFKRDHGNTISPLEYVLTHEIGHDVAKNTNAKAFENFKRVAGWQELGTDALREDGVTPDKLAELEKARPNPNEKQLNIGGDRRTYSPIPEKQTFWGIDQTAIPEEHAGVDRTDPNAPTDPWGYSRVNPAEHFADVYAKAVHVPKQLHHDLVEEPAKEAQRARDELKKQEDAVAQMEASSPRSSRLAEMRKQLATLEEEHVVAARAEKQRGEQFSVMRNEVFHTDQAVTAVSARLQAQGVSATKIADFKREAAIVSTPEQVEALASHVTP